MQAQWTPFIRVGDKINASENGPFKWKIKWYWWAEKISRDCIMMRMGIIKVDLVLEHSLKIFLVTIFGVKSVETNIWRHLLVSVSQKAFMESSWLPVQESLVGLSKTVLSLWLYFPLQQFLCCQCKAADTQCPLKETLLESLKGNELVLFHNRTLACLELCWYQLLNSNQNSVGAG